MSIKTEKKEGTFRIYMKHKKPFLVFLHIDNKTFFKFDGKKCLEDFVKEIFQNRYRGYVFSVVKNKIHDIPILYEYLNKHDYIIKTGFFDNTCFMIRLYTHVYYTEKGNVSHSNCITFKRMVF